jgi:hypothetical protein
MTAISAINVFDEVKASAMITIGYKPQFASKGTHTHDLPLPAQS